MAGRGGIGPAAMLRGFYRFMAERLAQGRKILKAGFAPEAMVYARRGVADSLRPAVWRAMLGLPKVSCLDTVRPSQRRILRSMLCAPPRARGCSDVCLLHRCCAIPLS